MSIYSRVHLGEPKLIEAHHNGLFISYWTDRRTPSLSLSFSLSLIRLSPLSHSAADMKREVESGWYRTLSDCGGLKVILCAFKMDSQSRFLGPTGWLLFRLARTHTHIYTQINASLTVHPNCQIALVSLHFHSQSQIALFSPVFLSLIRYFQIFQLPQRAVIWCTVLPSTPSPSVFYRSLSFTPFRNKMRI